MQFKVLSALASLVAVVAAVPREPYGKRDDAASASASADASAITVASGTAPISLTTAFTTDTFTASRVTQSLMDVEPFITTITTNTVFTVTHTVTSAIALPTSSA